MLLLTPNIPRDILLTLIIVLLKSTNFTENNSPGLVKENGDGWTSGHAQGFDRRAREGEGLKQGLPLDERSCHSHSQSHMHSSLVF